MELTSPTFLVMGLGDGRFCGWNLSTNSFDYIIAHQSPVTAMIFSPNLLLSGDSTGKIKIYDTTSFTCLFEGQVQLQ